VGFRWNKHQKTGAYVKKFLGHFQKWLTGLSITLQSLKLHQNGSKFNGQAAPPRAACPPHSDYFFSTGT